MANSTQDNMVVRVTCLLYQIGMSLSGVSLGSPAGNNLFHRLGVIVAAHRQLKNNELPNFNFDDFFAASANSFTEVAVK